MDNDNIQIPDGLEERLSHTIDGWAADETQRKNRRIKCAACVCVIALIGLFAGIAVFNSLDMTPPQAYTIADTYTNPEDAAEAINYAMQMLQQSFDQSFAELEQVNDDFGDMKNVVITL